MSLLDTSVAVALLVSDHSAHERTIAQLPQGSLGLSGHAVFETFSVITRLPNHRVSPAMAHTLISENFPRRYAMAKSMNCSFRSHCPKEKPSFNWNTTGEHDHAL